MNKLLLISIFVALASFNSFGRIHSWKGGVHLAAVPFIAGSGIYSSVRTLQDTDNRSPRAAAITDLALLGIQATGGTILLFGNDDLPPVLRTMHKIFGMGVVASGLWLSIANSYDDRVSPAARYTAYGHTILAAAPILLFTF